MTPEREKYLESITEREKALREEIDDKKRTLKNLKFRLSFSESRIANKIYKERIKKYKYILCALKHELERIQPTTDIKLIVARGYIYAYECCNCHKEFAVRDDDGTLKYCPRCHRRIERDF